MGRGFSWLLVGIVNWHIGTLDIGTAKAKGPRGGHAHAPQTQTQTQTRSPGGGGSGRNGERAGRSST
jgi:hypothetical protein